MEENKYNAYKKYLSEYLCDKVKECLKGGMDLQVTWNIGQSDIAFFVLKITPKTLLIMSTEDGYNAVIEQIVPEFESAINKAYDHKKPNFKKQVLSI